MKGGHHQHNTTTTGNHHEILKSSMFLAPIQSSQTSMWKPAKTPLEQIGGRRAFLKKAAITANVIALGATAQVAQASDDSEAETQMQMPIALKGAALAAILFTTAPGPVKNKFKNNSENKYVDLSEKK